MHWDGCRCWLVSLWGRCSVRYFPLSDDNHQNIYSTSCHYMCGDSTVTCSSRFGLGLSRTWNDFDRICSICSSGQRFGRCFSISKSVWLCILVWGNRVASEVERQIVEAEKNKKDLDTCRHAEWCGDGTDHAMHAMYIACASPVESSKFRGCVLTALCKQRVPHECSSGGWPRFYSLGVVWGVVTLTCWEFDSHHWIVHDHWGITRLRVSKY